jgi:hypothetical protein
VKGQVKTVADLSSRLKRQSRYWNQVRQVDTLSILKNQSINESETTVPEEEATQPTPGNGQF